MAPARGNGEPGRSCRMASVAAIGHIGALAALPAKPATSPPSGADVACGFRAGIPHARRRHRGCASRHAPWPFRRSSVAGRASDLPATCRLPPRPGRAGSLKVEGKAGNQGARAQEFRGITPRCPVAPGGEHAGLKEQAIMRGDRIPLSAGNAPRPCHDGSKRAMRGPGAGGGTRTHTLLRAADFESAASTDSATPARPRSIAQAPAPTTC